MMQCKESCGVYRDLCSWLYRTESLVQYVRFSFLAVNRANDFPVLDALLLSITAHGQTGACLNAERAECRKVKTAQ